MISITICDDEPGTCSDIENIILNYTHSHAIETVIEIFYSGETLYESMEKGYRTDLLFLDIQLFEMNGVEVGKKIREQLGNEKISIIYISSKETYAMSLFQVRPFDFLVKPIREEELFRVIGELRELLKERKKIFEYTDTKGIHKISYDKILYFYSLGKRVHIVTSEKEYEYRGKLKDVADVTEEYFLLIHKSYLINMEHVEHYEYDNVVMKDKTRLSISKANRKKVRERLLQTEKKRL